MWTNSFATHRALRTLPVLAPRGSGRRPRGGRWEEAAHRQGNFPAKIEQIVSHVFPLKKCAELKILRIFERKYFDPR
eukprot:73617-Prorocentrum_minimum.AAC.1